MQLWETGIIKNKYKDCYPRGLHNVFDNRPEMVKFKQQELIRAIKFVFNNIRKEREPEDIFEMVTSSYGFSIGYEAVKRVNNRLKIC